MSFTWNGQLVSDIIPVRATIAIDKSLLYNSTAVDAAMIEDKVKLDLAYKIASELHQFMTINSYEDYKTLRKIYEGTVHMAIIKTKNPLAPTTPLPGLINTSQFNGTTITSANTTGNSVYIAPSGSSVREYDKLRVCEYKKDGKVTRVELQRYEDGYWEKIPRVQIEE